MNKHKFWRYAGLIAAFATFLIALSSLAVAQERFGDIAGVVRDQSGAVLPDASVSITNIETNRVLTTSTRDDGTFAVEDIEPGRYRVTVEKSGFTRFEATNVLVLVGRTSRLEPNLTVGTVEQTVEVLGGAPLVDTTSTTIAHNITGEELTRLPKGRSFEGVAVFSPSVNTGTIEGGYQINGASSAENAYYVDGVSVNSVIDGSARQTSTFDYIQEVQVKTTGLDAEYGGALGGVVSAITKSGGNAFHGDLHYYYFGNKLNTDPPKRMAINPQVDFNAPFTYFNDTKNQRNNHEIGGSLGGPILRDKLWFYTAASPRWVQRRNQYQFTEDFDANGNPIYTPGSMARSAHQMNWFSKLSWNPTDRIRANFTYLYTPQYQTGSLYNYDAFAPNATTNSKEDALQDALRGYNQAENSYTGQVDFTLTSTSLLSVKGGRYYLNYKEVGVPSDIEYYWRTDSSTIPGIDPDVSHTSNYVTPSGARVAHDLTTRTYVQADFSQLTNFLGQHNFKLGVGTTKNVNNVRELWYGERGRVELYFNASCALCGGATGPFGYYAVNDGRTDGSAGSNITHLYVQDSWRIHPRLTINPGVRFEKETIPSFRPDIQKFALQFGWGDKIAPRLGASFDLLGNGKVKISGGWGRYYDWTKFDLPRGTFGADVWKIYYRPLESLDPSYILNLSLLNMPGADLWAASHAGATFRDRRIPGFDFLDPNVKPMSVDALNAGVEWQVRNDMVVSARYVRTNLNRTIEDMGVLVNGSEAYFYGNPGEGQNTLAPSCYTSAGSTCTVPMPKAKRVYDAMELSLTRRFSGGWLASANYTYSKLWGNYSGLQSTDEIRPSTLGYGFSGNQEFASQLYRPGGNANRYFDLDEAFFDANGNSGLYGRLPTDRPHVFKFYGAKEFSFGTQIGTFFRVMSGTPVTTQVDTANQIPMYVNGRGDAGRTPVFSQTDLVVAHTLSVGEAKSLRFEFNVLNLFNQKTSMFTFDRYTREEHSDATGMNLTGVDLRQGFDWQGLLATQAAADGRPVDLDSRYGHAAEFNDGLQARFLIKFTF